MNNKVYDLVYNIAVREGVWYTEYYTVREDNLDLDKLVKLISDEYKVSADSIKLEKQELREAMNIEKITKL